MQLFGEQVSHTSTNSPLNILQVEVFSEIFFDVFEVELNKKKYPVEKVAEYKGNPVVSIPILVEGVEVFYPFVLSKGKSKVLFNKDNTSIPIIVDGVEEFHPFIMERNASGNIIVENIVEDLPKIVEESIPTKFISIDNQKIIREQIESAKQDARQYAINIKRKKIDEANIEIKNNKKILKQTLDDARDNLVEEFISISNKIKKELVDVSSTQYSEIKETLENKIQFISEDLEKSLREDFNSASEEFDSNIRKFITETYNTIILPKVAEDLTEISKDIVQLVDQIETSIIEKIDSKAEKTLVEGVTLELDALRIANIELNDSFNKGVNRALSRVGNVKTQVDNLETSIIEKIDTKAEKTLVENVTLEIDDLRLSTIELSNSLNKGINRAINKVENVKGQVDNLESTFSQELNDKISEAVDNISYFYSEKIQLLENKTIDVTEESRKYFIGLINDSKNNLLAEIGKIKTEKPVEYIIESGKKLPEKVDLSSLKKEYDKIIADKFSNEVVNLRKYISVYASGGGTNATQYQDGGVMNGAIQINDNLTVLGSISASSYLGLSIPSGDYLPLSGGNMTGLLSSNNSIIVQTISAGGDITMPNNSYGVIMFSPNGTKYRFTINDDGSLQTTSI